MSRGKWIGLCVGLLLLLGGGVFAYGYFREDPQLAAVRALGEQMRNEDWRNLPDEERRKRFGAMREAMDSLSDEQRAALWEEREQEMMIREDQRLTEFFALSPEEQRKALDAEIKRDEERRKQWEQRQRERENGDRPRGDRADRGPGGPGGRDGFRGGPPGGRSNDPTVRNERRRERLDRSTPQARARRAEHRRMIAERRQQLGLPPQTRGPRRG